MFKKKDHTEVAGRIAEDALGLFHNVKSSLLEANSVLEEGINADTGEVDRLTKRVATAKGQKTGNENVVAKLEQLLS